MFKTASPWTARQEQYPRTPIDEGESRTGEEDGLVNRSSRGTPSWDAQEDRYGGTPSKRHKMLSAKRSLTFVSRKKLLWISGSTIAIVLLIALLSQSPSMDTISEWSKTSFSSISGASDSSISTILDEDAPSAMVPNVAHFVILGDAKLFSIPLATWLGIWSCQHWMKPEKILIHTNYDPAVVDRAKQFPPNRFTAALFRIPAVQFNHVEAPHATSDSRKMAFQGGWPHSSDFVRTRILAEQGGVYLDSDSYLLRDPAPLRKTGYSMVVGQQMGGYINVAAFFATPGNTFMATFARLIDVVYDGSWGRHSFELLTRLTQIFRPKDGEVLVLPQDSLFPLSWERDDLITLYRPLTKGVSIRSPEFETSTSELAAQRFSWTNDPANVRDWSSSYVLHGWNSAIYDDRRVKDAERKEWFGAEQGGVLSIEYLLRRDSNFANAVWPALRAAILEGNLAVTSTQRNLFDVLEEADEEHEKHTKHAQQAHSS